MSAPEKQISVLIVDDHRLFRDGLKKNIEEDRCIRIVGEAGNGRDAVTLAGTYHPDVVTMDINLPDLSGIEATRKIREMDPGIKIIGLSMYSDRPFVLGMIQAGASGFLTKTCSSRELTHAIHTIFSGKSYICDDLKETVILTALESREQNTAVTDAALTIREQQILRFIADGRTSTYIAKVLGISVRTVEKHRKNIMDKLNIRTVALLTKYAIRQGLTFLE